MGIKGKNDRMVVLACEDCKERNYTTTKNKKTLKKDLNWANIAQNVKNTQTTRKLSSQYSGESS